MQNIRSTIARNLIDTRVHANFELTEVSSQTNLDLEYLLAIESCVESPTIETLIILAALYGRTVSELIGEATPTKPELSPTIVAVEDAKDIIIHFPYSKHDATFRLPNAQLSEFIKVRSILKSGLSALSNSEIANNDQVATAIKRGAVTDAAFEAFSLWPSANPSDVWWFVIYRLFCDPTNHPSTSARLDFSQSWKRTGGWALEEIVVRKYRDILQSNGIRIFIASNNEKSHFLQMINLEEHRLEFDKIDVILTGKKNGRDHFFGVIHIKASFAERRTDDVPLSKALCDAGFYSPLWTMDCKSTPSANPRNRGELGQTWSGSGVDGRSAKRKDIEDDAYFSACFSYNTNSLPTPDSYQKAKAKVYVCDFSESKNQFVKHLLDFWKKFSASI